MSEKIYQGPSEGLSELISGYVDYAEEVIIRRAIPDLRDGQKLVNRRILYAMYLNRKDYLQKSVTMVGKVLEYHPHGDASAYGSMSLMTDENGSYNVPPLIGDGNYGKVGMSMKPAHMRYTKVQLQPYTIKDFFDDADVMDMVMSEEGIEMEPSVLNVSYPAVLVNGANGIAVAAGVRLASFNFKDVLELTIKYLKNGELTLDDMIYPDFPGGGVMVCNKEEVAKIMLTGKGKLKIRAKVEIEGSEIIVKEIPIGKFGESIVTKVKEGDIYGVKDAGVTLSRDPDTGYVSISCKNKKVVEEVLMRLYQKNILQSTFSSNILVINNGKAEILGVYGIVEKWCEWREQVVIKKVALAIKEINNTLRTYKPFIQLIDNPELKDKFIDIITHVGRSEAIQLLMEELDDCDVDVAKWIAERSIHTFRTGGTYRDKYEELLKDLDYWKNFEACPRDYIIMQLEELLRTRGNNYPRKTELSFKDYKFSKITDSTEVVDDSSCVYTIMKNGFMIKSRNPIERGDVLVNIKAQANSILIGFDNYGRVLRISGEDVQFTPGGSDGLYLPRYFGVGDEATQFDYKILYMCPLDGTKKMLVYRDGYIGFFDTSEYYGKKLINVVNQGVCLAVRDKLLEIYEENQIPEYLLLADDTGSKVKVGVVVTNTIPERSRLSRAKVLSCGGEINTKYLKGFNGMGLASFISDPDDYIGKLKVFKGDWYGDPGEVQDGYYLEMCKDLNVEGV